jgi:tetratricopeptide (TPR) repeat protein
MVYDDYLIRIIRQAAAVFARILGLKKSGDYQDALEEIYHNLEQLFGLDTKIINLLDDESLYSHISQNEHNILEGVKFAADLFNEEGKILILQSNLLESDSSFSRSLSLYLKIDSNNDPLNPIEVSQMIDEIIQNINVSSLPSKTLFELFCYLENKGKYAKAEEILIALSSRPEDKVDAVREMKLYYERLLDKGSKELDAQGMSLKLLQEKIKDL